MLRILKYFEISRKIDSDCNAKKVNLKVLNFTLNRVSVIFTALISSGMAGKQQLHLAFVIVRDLGVANDRKSIQSCQL